MTEIALATTFFISLGAANLVAALYINLLTVDMPRGVRIMPIHIGAALIVIGLMIHVLDKAAR